MLNGGGGRRSEGCGEAGRQGRDGEPTMPIDWLNGAGTDRVKSCRLFIGEIVTFISLVLLFWSDMFLRDNERISVYKGHVL